MGYYRSGNMETISETIYARSSLSSACEMKEFERILERVFRLELHRENSLNNYLLLWNPKQHRSTSENYECINLFRMKLQHFLAIPSDVIMDSFHRLCLINHHRYSLIRINVRSNSQLKTFLIYFYYYFLVPTDQVEPHATNQTFELVLDRGTRYIVVDCGGGTVDITVHELDNKMGTLKELYKATGGPYGSVGMFDLKTTKILD